MFDFINYTYSGLLSIVAALMGLACPLIIGRVEAIDKRYHSSLLTRRFMHEVSFIGFAILIALNIVSSIIVPFLMDESELGKWYLLVQSGLMTLLLASLFILFYDMLQYADRQKLQELILEDYHKAEKKNDNTKQEIYFNQWVDLVPSLVASADDTVERSVYDEWERMVIVYYKNRNEKKVFDDYFLEGLTRINENLCQSKRRLMSVNNANSIVTSLFYLDMPMSDKHYGYLWKNLLLQVYYDRDEWLMTYWEAASQRYQLFVEQKEELEKERWDFLEFNIFFVAMLLQQKKYELVKRMLTYTRTVPESYPLVPSTISRILASFNRIYRTSQEPVKFLYYESRYHMPNMYGISDGKILGAAYSYLALLMYRVYTLIWNYGEDYALNSGLSSRGLYLNDIRQWEEVLQILKYWLKVLKEENNKSLMDIVNYDDDTISELSARGYEHIPNPDQIIQDTENIVKKAKEDITKNQPLSKDIVKNLNEEVVRIINNAVMPFTPFLKGESKENTECEVNRLLCSTSQPYPRAAFLDNPDICYVNIEETITYASINAFLLEMGRRFFMMHRSAVYTISFDDLPKALSKLKLNAKYAILSFGFNWDNLVAENNMIEKIDQSTWRYGRTKIYEIPSNYRLFERMLYIIRVEDIPSLIFTKPSEGLIQKYQLGQINEDHEIWTSILDLKNHPELHEPIKELGEKIDEYSLFTLGWEPVIRQKKDVKVIAIKVWYKLFDEGNPDEIGDIKPIEPKVKRNKNGEQE